MTRWAFAAWALFQVASHAQVEENPTTQVVACDIMTVTHVSQHIPCATIGSLMIDPDVSGDLDLDGVREVEYLAMINNMGLNSLTSKSLTRVNNGIYLTDSGTLGSIVLPSLSFVGRFEITNAPNLGQITLGEEGVMTAETISIWDTWLYELQLNPKSVNYLVIRNNPNLLNFSSKVESLAVGGDFDLDVSGSSLHLPNLVWAGEVYVGHLNEVNLQSLESVKTTLEFANNTFDSMSLPVLKTVGGLLSVANDSEVAKIDFPQLIKVGNLAVINNTALVELDGFPKLAEVDDRVDLEGDFKYVEMPSLSDAEGGLWVKSSENISYSCAALEKIFQSERPHQTFECRGSDDTSESNQEGTNTSGQDGAQTAPTPSLSGGAIAGVVVGALAAVGILAAGFFIVRKRRRTGAAVEGATSVVDADGPRDPKYSSLHPDESELQGNPRSELASPDPELEGSRVNDAGTVYYEVEDTGRVGRK